MKIKAVGARSAKQPPEPMDITQREPRPHDVKIEIAYCGACHSDTYRICSEWAETVYPYAPGHEVVGCAVAVGDQVEKYASGGLVGAGCIVDSYKHYEECEDGLGNYCDHMIGTYNLSTPDKPDHTLGGHSQQIVACKRYVLRIHRPQEQLAAAVPLLYVGITTYPPLHHWLTRPDRKVGMVGIGGLGHMEIELARAMGARVVIFTIPESGREAAKALGVNEVVNSRNADETVTHVESFDSILNTVATSHNLDDFATLLKCDGTITLVDVSATSHKSPRVFNLIMKRHAIAGSMIGGIPETQETFDLRIEHGIVANIEMIRADQTNETYE